MTSERLLAGRERSDCAALAAARGARAHPAVVRHERRPGLGDLCMTQAGFVRIVSNPAFSRRVVSPRDALEVLRANLQHRAHRFWADDLGVAEALAQFEGRLNGHQQVTDGYLLALAIHQKGRLATLDSGVASLLADQSDEKKHLVLV